MCCNNRRNCGCQYVQMCEPARKINYSICRGYYVDNPCCPLTYIGNNGTPTTTTPNTPEATN